MKDFAEKVLGVSLDHIFPIRVQMKEAEEAGRELKPEEVKTRTWDYEPLLRARVFYAETAAQHRGLEGNAEADELFAKCTEHIKMLNDEWDRIGIFKKSSNS